MAGPEHKVQVAIIKYLRQVIPGVMIQHCRNEHGKRGKAGMYAAQLQKSAGVMSGFPDLIVLPDADIGRGAFFIEVKSAKGRVSDTQAQVHAMLQARNYPVIIARSIDDVRDGLIANGIPFKEVKRGVTDGT